MLLSLLLFNGCLCLFLRRFGANWIYDFSRIIPLLFGLCGPKRSSVIAVRGKRIYAYLNDQNPLVGFLFSLKLSFSETGKYDWGFGLGSSVPRYFWVSSFVFGELFFRGRDGWLCLGIDSICGPERTSIGNSQNSSVQVRGFSRVS